MTTERTDETQTARTTEPEGADDTGNGAEREPGEAGRDAAESTDTTDYKALWLGSGKPAVEEQNRRQREEQETFVERPGPSPVSPARADVDPLDMDDESYIRHMAATGSQSATFALNNDPVALDAILTKRDAQRDRRDNEVWRANVVLNEQLKAIADPDMQAEALKRWRKNHDGRYRDIRDIHRELKAEADRKENETLRAELAKNTRRGPADAVKTHERDVTATEIKARVVERAAWQRTQDELEFTNPSQFRANQRERRSGAVKFKGE